MWIQKQIIKTCEREFENVKMQRALGTQRIHRDHGGKMRKFKILKWGDCYSEHGGGGDN
jgi:hypothetical protein